MKEKESFGEQALFKKSIRKVTVIAETDMILLSLSRESANKILGK